MTGDITEDRPEVPGWFEAEMMLAGARQIAAMGAGLSAWTTRFCIIVVTYEPERAQPYAAYFVSDDWKERSTRYDSLDDACREAVEIATTVMRAVKAAASG